MGSAVHNGPRTLLVLRGVCVCVCVCALLCKCNCMLTMCSFLLGNPSIGFLVPFSNWALSLPKYLAPFPQIPSKKV